jgi:hypothetical protein
MTSPPDRKQRFSSGEEEAFARALIELASREAERRRAEDRSAEGADVSLHLNVTARFDEGGLCCRCFWSRTEGIALCFGDCC